MRKQIPLVIFITILNLYYTSSLTSSLVSEKTTIRPQKCTSEVTYRLNGYDCAHLDLFEIPRYLKSNTEILDASFNRIRKLNRTSFSHLTYLKYLYLHENIIQTIEEGTFSYLTDLEAVDLSVNGLRTIPLELFQLPLLRNFYARTNDLVDFEKNLRKMIKPIKAPLVILDFSDCSLQRVPQFGILPKLYSFNISFNPLNEISPNDFSSYCNLKKIDLNETKTEFCSCLTTISYLKKRGITLISPTPCEATIPSQAICNNINDSDENEYEENEDYQKCLEFKKIIVKKEASSMTWMTIAISLFAFFIIFIAFLYCLHRRNVRQMKKRMKLENKIKAQESSQQMTAMMVIKDNCENLLDVDKN